MTHYIDCGDISIIKKFTLLVFLEVMKDKENNKSLMNPFLVEKFIVEEIEKYNIEINSSKIDIEYMICDLCLVKSALINYTSLENDLIFRFKVKEMLTAYSLNNQICDLENKISIEKFTNSLIEKSECQSCIESFSKFNFLPTQESNVLEQHSSSNKKIRKKENFKNKSNNNRKKI